MFQYGGFVKLKVVLGGVRLLAMQSVPLIQGKESAEKTARSIFVGNIPYEATEEKLVELFSKVGLHITVSIN